MNVIACSSKTVIEFLRKFFGERPNSLPSKKKMNVIACSSKTVIEFLREFFGERLVNVPLWAPRSPDLTPLDFFVGSPQE